MLARSPLLSSHFLLNKRDMYLWAPSHIMVTTVCPGPSRSATLPASNTHTQAQVGSEHGCIQTSTKVGREGWMVAPLPPPCQTQTPWSRSLTRSHDIEGRGGADEQPLMFQKGVHLQAQQRKRSHGVAVWVMEPASKGQRGHWSHAPWRSSPRQGSAHCHQWECPSGCPLRDPVK